VTLSGARGLVRVSINPRCDLQAAMAVERKREPSFYREVTGREFPGEYGERLSARRRGAKFEANLHANEAAELRRAVGPLYGLDPDVMWVRDFAQEVPGPPTTMRAQRLVRTRRIIEDLAADRPVPQLLIQPQLRLPTGPERLDFEHISPDYMVLDPAAGMYVPGEEKSFVVRDNVADPGDLDLTRRQAAAQILALRSEAERVGLGDRVAHRAAFVFATPYGLRPAPVREEHLPAEVHAMIRAVEVYSRVRAELVARRATDDAPLAMLVDEIPTSFAESCLGRCILADQCEMRHIGTARGLGDAAARVLGAASDRATLRALFDPNFAPVDPAIAVLATRLHDAGTALGLAPAELRRRLA
jgi:hypothetical protein